MKIKGILLLLPCLFLASCQNVEAPKAEIDKQGEVVSERTVFTKEGRAYAEGEQTDSAPSFVYDSSKKIVQGDKVDIKTFVKLQNSQSQEFKAHILSTEGEVTPATSPEDGSTEITFRNAKATYVNVVADDVSATLEILVSPSEEAKSLEEKLSTLTNYTIDAKTYKAYRTSNYYYNSAAQSGFLIPSGTNSAFRFILSDVSNSKDDFEITVPDYKDPGILNEYYGDLSSLTSKDLTFYKADSVDSENADLKLEYGLFESAADGVFNAFGLDGTFIIEDTSYTRYGVLFGYDTSLHIALLGKDSSGNIYQSPSATVTDIGSTRVDVLEQYLEAKEAPKEISAASLLKHTDEVLNGLNYSITNGSFTYTDFQGKDVTSQITDNSLLWTKEAQVTENAVYYKYFWSIQNVTDADGKETSVGVGGGLFNGSDSNVYSYKEKLNSNNKPVYGNFELGNQYSEGTADYPYWFLYQGGYRALISNAFNTSNFSSFVMEDLGEGSYKLVPYTSGALDTLKDLYQLGSAQAMASSNMSASIDATERPYVIIKDSQNNISVDLYFDVLKSSNMGSQIPSDVHLHQHYEITDIGTTEITGIDKVLK